MNAGVSAGVCDVFDQGLFYNPIEVF